jgi:hypothetical protein
MKWKSSAARFGAKRWSETALVRGRTVRVYGMRRNGVSGFIEIYSAI